MRNARRTYLIEVRRTAYKADDTTIALPPVERIKVRCVKLDTALQTALGHGRSQLAREMADRREAFDADHPSPEWHRHEYEAKHIPGQ